MIPLHTILVVLKVGHAVVNTCRRRLLELNTPKIKTFGWARHCNKAYHTGCITNPNPNEKPVEPSTEESWGWCPVPR